LIRSHKDLRVWEASMDMAVAVYRATDTFPKQEMFGLVSQMRRSASSVPANIAEGFSRQHKTEFVQFLHISKGSLSELQTHIDLSQRLGFLAPSAAASLEEKTDAVGKMLYGLLSTVKKATTTSAKRPRQTTDDGRRATDDK
jgi:four helix bundle protein